MRARWPILTICLTLGLAYAAYPYFTLYRLSQAVRGADAGTLETLVDWPSVREGIKEDICDFVVDDGDSQRSAKLPPFGASFVRGIAVSSVDQKVTPQAIVAATGAPSATKNAAAGVEGDSRVVWAFFDSPTVFSVELRAQGMADPIRLKMELREGAWQVRRVWLPRELLSAAPAHT